MSFLIGLARKYPSHAGHTILGMILSPLSGIIPGSHLTTMKCYQERTSSDGVNSSVIPEEVFLKTPNFPAKGDTIWDLIIGLLTFLGFW
jgi:hypothetical protein